MEEELPTCKGLLSLAVQTQSIRPSKKAISARLTKSSPTAPGLLCDDEGACWSHSHF